MGITGDHLFGDVAVFFGNQRATVVSHNSNQEIGVIAPPHPVGTASVTVTTLSGTAINTPPITVS